MSAVAARVDLASLVAEYVDRNPRSRALTERARQSLPGGNTRTGVWMDPFPPYIERGDGVWLHDLDGHRLLDFAFNNSSQIHGHAHPAIVEAVQRAAVDGTGYNRPTEAEVEWAELMRTRVPSLELVRFCNSGTEAVINALRAAIAFTGRRTIARCEGAYHGAGDHALVSYLPPIGPALGPAERPIPYLSSAGLSGAADETIVIPFNDLAACEAILTEHADDLAAVLIDPLMTNCGVIMPEEGFLAGIRDIAHRLGALLVFDEVVAFRVASGGAQGLLGVTPDLSAFGKVAAGGMAGGVFGGRADVMALFDPTHGAKIQHAGTFNANPLTTAAAIVTLTHLTPDAYALMADQSRQVALALADVLEEAGVPGSTQAVGSIFRVYLCPEPPHSYRETAHDDKATHRKLTLWLLNHDVHWQQGGYTSTVTENAHLDQLVTTVRAGLREL